MGDFFSISFFLALVAGYGWGLWQYLKWSFWMLKRVVFIRFVSDSFDFVYAFGSTYEVVVNLFIVAGGLFIVLLPALLFIKEARRDGKKQAVTDGEFDWMKPGTEAYAEFQREEDEKRHARDEESSRRHRRDMLENRFFDPSAPFPGMYD